MSSNNKELLRSRIYKRIWKKKEKLVVEGKKDDGR